MHINHKQAPETLVTWITKIFKTVDVTKTNDVRNESHRIPDSVGRKEEGHARKLNPCLAHGQLGNCFCAL